MEVTEEHKNKTRDLIIEGRSIEAIKYLRQELQLDLKTANRLVQAIREQIDPSEISSPPNTLPTRAFGKFAFVIPGVFLLTGIVMLGIAAYIYSEQSAVIERSLPVKATVIASPSSPLFEYEYEGKKYQYQSSVSSNPPSYDLGEEVDFFVDTQNPYNGIPNTFTERWFVIVIVGGLGVTFSVVSILVILAFRSKV